MGSGSRGGVLGGLAHSFSPVRVIRSWSFWPDATLRSCARNWLDHWVIVGRLDFGTTIAQAAHQVMFQRTVPSKPASRNHDPRVDVLTPRERQIIRLIALGASNKEIAHQLSITERTVKAHLTNVFQKLGLSTRLQLAIQVLSGGLPD